MATFLDDAIARVGFDRDDETRVRALRGSLGAAAPAIAVELADLDGPSTPEFCDRCAAIGWRYAELGLPACALIVAASAARTACTDRIAAVDPAAPAIDWLRSFDKLVDLELTVALRAYQVEVEQRLVARELRRHADRSAATQTLWSGLAHELRNPLNSAQLQLDVLARRLNRCVSDARLVEPAELARHEIERLSALIDDFLVVARPPALAPAIVDVVTIVEHVVEVEHALAEQRGVELRVIVPDVRAQSRVDADKVYQIVHNLVRNAVEAAARGGDVEVQVIGQRDHVQIRVADDGPGIPDAVRARMYEPFFTTKENGTGLGLAIVSSLVAMHGGKIDVETSPAGTRFDVVLPFAA